MPDDFEEVGYSDHMDVPLPIREMLPIFERAKKSLED